MNTLAHVCVFEHKTALSIKINGKESVNDNVGELDKRASRRPNDSAVTRSVRPYIELLTTVVFLPIVRVISQKKEREREKKKER